MTARNELDNLLSSEPTHNKQDVVEAVSYAVPALVGSLFCITKFVRAAHRGQYDKATFYAVVWAGWSNNTARTFNARFGRRFSG